MQELWRSHLRQDHTGRNKSPPQHTVHDGALPLSAELHVLYVYSEGTAQRPRSTYNHKVLQNCHALDVHSAKLPRPILVFRRHCRTATLYMCTQKTLQNCDALYVYSEDTAELPRSMCTQKTLQNCHALHVYSEDTAELPRSICVLRRHCRTATP